jgi:hypothetical protein
MRLWLALRAFFAILFGRPLAVQALVELGVSAPRELEAPVGGAVPAPTVPDSPPPEPPKPAPPVPPEERPKAAPTPTAPEPPRPATPARPDAAAVQVLSVLQSEGRLLDFLAEDIEGYSDNDIGAAVRDIHRGLRRALADHFPVAPVRSEDEEASVTVPEGFDPAQIRLVGNVVGKPPFQGTLKHKGWRVTKVELPRIPDDGEAARIVAPAEVEL